MSYEEDDYLYADEEYERPRDAEHDAAIVRKAAETLDTVIPGWHNAVDLGRLEMGDCTMCMLGQTFGIEAELAIAKELYPEEWEATRRELAESYVRRSGGGRYHSVYDTKTFRTKEEAAQHGLTRGYGLDGYTVGQAFFKKRGMYTTELQEACSGNIDACVWAEVIAERRAQEESSEAN